MLFNSIDFAIFLPTVFLIYWVFKSHRSKQNIVILLASYIFYGWWDWRFLLLIVISSLVDYTVGLGLSKTDDSHKRKLLLLISIFVNLSFLGFFKYYNFFLENFIQAFIFFGHPINPQRLNIILPVGISFYTFQTLSYSIDVYKKKFTPTKDIIAFFSFVSFFPQLVAGPIERASNLLPQFLKKRTFQYSSAVDGMRQLLWGFLKKIVIADNCAIYTYEVFTNHTNYNGSELFLAAIFFAIQIYGDFSGYSDIAIGTSRLFGFDLKKNFAYPNFSRNMAEHWRRWHISLLSWLRDYVYIPLGGSRGTILSTIRNVFIVFLVAGFWHGARWTFIVWGLINAFLILPLILRRNNKRKANVAAQGRIFPSIKEVFSIGLTFLLWALPFPIFVAENLQTAFSYYSHMLSNNLFSVPVMPSNTVLIIILLFYTIEWFGREYEHPLHLLNLLSFKIFRWVIYFLIIATIYIWGGKPIDFYYFQF